jgi:hypothetical protein
LKRKETLQLRGATDRKNKDRLTNYYKNHFKCKQHTQKKLTDYQQARIEALRNFANLARFNR